METLGQTVLAHRSSLNLSTDRLVVLYAKP